MKFLVTGGCGFVGSALVRRLLTEGHEVMAVDDLSKGTLENLGSCREQVQVIRQDITRGLDGLLSSFRPDVIFHLAALHFIPDCDSDPLRCLRVNAEGTRAILDAAALLEEPSAVVLASSAAVYAPSDEPHHEDSPLAPIDVYGFSKLWTEELALRYAERTGAGVGIARLFNVFGPGETNAHFIPSLICQLKAGKPVKLGNLSSRRDYVFVEDVADALVRLGHHSATGQSVTVNVGTGLAYSGYEVVQSLTGANDPLSNPTIVSDPRRFRAVDRPMLQANPDFARKVLNWTPRMSLLEGLKAAWQHPLSEGVTVS
jgi:UDP-glucose 4-epimerase